MRKLVRILSRIFSVAALLNVTADFFGGRMVVAYGLQPNRNKVTVHLRNEAHLRWNVAWINRDSQAQHAVGILEPFGTVSLDTFGGHKFALVEIPAPEHGERCSYLASFENTSYLRESPDGCAIYSFSVGPQKEQYLMLSERMLVRDDTFMKSLVNFRTRDLQRQLDTCRTEIWRRLEKAEASGFGSQPTTNRLLSQLEDCLSLAAVPALKRANDQVVFESRVRSGIASFMEEYTCNSIIDEGTPDQDLREWTNGDVTRAVHVKFERPAARIHVVEDFASREECMAMEERVDGRLGRATTSDGKGGFQLNENRKALQAEIYPDWSSLDPIVRINRRIFDYTTDVLGLNISVEGQEPLMSIQYFGKGYDDTTPDRYSSHCDGSCEGRPYRHAGRMATMVVYCRVPDNGGGMTNFGNAGVTIKPVTGSAIFFSYIDPITNITDKGFSQHSGCPVYEGNKTIITQWIRYGVTKEQTADHYNSLDVLVSEDGE